MLLVLLKHIAACPNTDLRMVMLCLGMWLPIEKVSDAVRYEGANGLANKNVLLTHAFQSNEAKGRREAVEYLLKCLGVHIYHESVSTATPDITLVHRTDKSQRWRGIYNNREICFV